MSKELRAQGPVEYLVIAGVVLVVALVAINLLGFFPGTAGDSGATASQAYWLSARPTGIYEAKTTSSTCNTSTRGYMMTLENHETSPIRLTGIAIAGQNHTFCRPGQATTGEIRLETYEKAAIEVPAAIPSTAGKAMSVNVSISYTSAYGLTGVQHGSNPLVITNDLPPQASCANIGESCASLSCCSPNTCNASSVCQTPCTGDGGDCSVVACCQGLRTCWFGETCGCTSGSRCAAAP
ncbi:MAG: hypothetical protein WC861_03110 [Candidatus Micrarchaeia archaeon]